MGDRRIPFFLVAAIVCAALVPVTPDGLRGVPVVVSAVYAVLTLLTALDQRAAKRRRNHP